MAKADTNSRFAAAKWMHGCIECNPGIADYAESIVTEGTCYDANEPSRETRLFE